MVLLIISIALTVIGAVFLIICFTSNSSYDRETTSIEQKIDVEKNKWVAEFSDHLKRIFTAPCPTCSTNTILSEGVETEVRSYPSPTLEGSYDYLLLTTKSFTRYCPKCEKTLLEPVPMKELKTEEVYQKRAFEGGKPYKIIQMHHLIGWIVDQFAADHLDEHDRWGYRPGAKLLDYEESLKSLRNKMAKNSRLFVWGWIFIPIGIVLFLFWVFL